MQFGRIIGTIRTARGNFIRLIIRQLQKIINLFVNNACLVLVKGITFVSSNQNNTMSNTINTNTLYRVTIRGNHQAINGATHDVFGDRALEIADKYYDGEEIPDTIADGTWHWIDCDHSIKIEEL